MEIKNNTCTHPFRCVSKKWKFNEKPLGEPFLLVE